MCTIAVKQNGSALMCVKFQTLDICKIAVENDFNVMKYVKDEFVSLL